MDMWIQKYIEVCQIFPYLDSSGIMVLWTSQYCGERHIVQYPAFKPQANVVKYLRGCLLTSSCPRDR